MSSRRLAVPVAFRPYLAATVLPRMLSHLIRLSAVARSRRRLLLLDDHLLRDIGLTRHEARAEAERPAWDAPSHWKG